MDMWEISREKNMAVHIEFFSVIVPVRAIEERFRGGMARFREACGKPPTDGKLVRMGAMNQMDLLDILHTLERGGMKGAFWKDGREHWLDFCVVDRCSGPTLPCEWIEVDLEEGTVSYRDK
ncbi:MAG: hypothetical protein ABIN18_03965 [Pseudomonadota bacterium]